MTPFQMYCSECRRDILIFPPHELNGFAWVAGCEHGKEKYIAHLHREAERVKQATWIHHD